MKPLEQNKQNPMTLTKQNKLNKKKDRMFQYATRFKYGTEIYKDTGLITKKEADELWKKYYPKVVSELKDGAIPEMVIWKNCVDVTDYHTKEKEIYGSSDLEVIGNEIYKITKTKL